MGRTCQLIFSPSITTMLVQCIGSTAGGVGEEERGGQGRKGVRWAF